MKGYGKEPTKKELASRSPARTAEGASTPGPGGKAPNLPHLGERLAARGLRPTIQREHVYRVLMQQRDHPTAEQVFMRAKKEMPEISMATVYNCLDALVKCGLVKGVNVERTAMRYCPNMHEHWHFRCDTCGAVFDIDMPAAGGEASSLPVKVPRGFQVTTYEISARGACPKCTAASEN